MHSGALEATCFNAHKWVILPEITHRIKLHSTVVMEIDLTRYARKYISFY